MIRWLVCLLLWNAVIASSVAQAQSAVSGAKTPPTAASTPVVRKMPVTAPSLAIAVPETDGIRQDGDSAARSGLTLPSEDWLVRPMPKPNVGVYHGCRLYVPEDVEQAKKAERAEPVGKFRNPHDAAAPTSEKPEGRSYLWCREAAGERGVDLLANHDQTVSRTLGHTLQAHRLLEQTISLDLEIGQKRSALSDDLKQQVAKIRDDVRKEVAANVAQRTWTIAGWSIAGAFFLTTVTLTTVVVLR